MNKWGVGWYSDMWVALLCHKSVSNVDRLDDGTTLYSNGSLYYKQPKPGKGATNNTAG